LLIVILDNLRQVSQQKVFITTQKGINFMSG